MSVTLFITACNRPDLLFKTLESFVKYNTYPIEKCIIIEDSGKLGINEFAKSICNFPVETIYNETNMTQIPSIEKGYSLITTDYIFHCEEDWEFYKPGFIEHSMEILKKDPSVISVWLRAYNDTNGHPIEYEDRGGYRYLITDYGYWHGFTFNPGLRRLSDYKLFAPWHETCKPYLNNLDHPMEHDLSILYHKHGYRGAITLDPEGYIRHIGWDRHVRGFWEK